jgi:methionyl-tRNA formyltransferase
MNIVLLCAARRGLLFLEELARLAPTDELTVFSFREQGGEPRFFDDIAGMAGAVGSRFIEARDVNGPAAQNVWSDRPIDLLLAVGWRYMVPKKVFAVPTRGSFVFHDSLLPENRGFSPTVWAIANGEDHTGVSLFEMTDEVDAGDVIDQEAVPISHRDTIREVLERTTATYLRILKRNLDSLKAGTAPRHPQNHEKATYCRKRVPDDNVISWDWDRSRVHNLIRAVTRPYPGAETLLDGRRLRIWAAQPLDDATDGTAPPGTVTQIRPGIGVVVQTGGGRLLVTSVQVESDSPTTADKILDQRGIILGNAAIESPADVARG